jgi:hypothetical protein
MERKEIFTSRMRNAELRNHESALWISARSPMVVTSSKRCRENLEVDKLHFGVSGTATWRVEMPRNRNRRNVKTPFGVGCGHNHWSHRWKMEEGASATKLHFGVSGIGT